MALTLYHSPGTRSIRPYWLLEEMGLDYELISHPYNPKYFASEEFLAINPMGKVPALRDGDNLIVESTVIMEYVLNRYGPHPLGAQPSDDDYGHYLQWLHMAESGMTNYAAVAFGHKSGFPKYKVSEEFDTYCKFQVKKAMNMLEGQIEGRDFILARGFSAADISMAYALFMTKSLVGMALSPPVKDYYNRLRARPLFAKVMSDIKPL